MRMEVVRLDDEQMIGWSDAMTAVTDRLELYEVGFDFPRIVFERSGRYEFRVFANGRFVSSAVLLVEAAA
jgi:hypothetical protein